MIFIKVKTRIDPKKTLDKEYMFSFFKKRGQKFLSINEKLIDLKIDLIRNFQGKFRNMGLRYELIITPANSPLKRGRKRRGVRKKIVRARIHKYQDIPRREWRVLNYFKKVGLEKITPRPLDYFKPLNILFYLETPGYSFEGILAQRKPNILLRFVPLIAKWLNRIHGLNKRLAFLPVKTIQEEKRERQHWFFLVRKCMPSFYPLFSQLLKELWGLKQKNKGLFLKPSQYRLVHGDFHWGNIIRNKNNFRIIDFGTAFLGDPLEDIGGFLAQNDSMFRYYAPRFIKKSREIREVFLKNYFKKPFLKSQKCRLLYFEIQKILEMAAILALIESNEKNKTRGVARLLREAEKKIKIVKMLKC